MRRGAASDLLSIHPSEVRGRRLISWPSLWDDLRNAGAEAVGEQVVIDG